MRRRVLVTDGEERAALAVVRSLGRAGHVVRVCSPRARTIAGASRWCAGADVVPDPLRRPAESARAVREICAREGVHALVPITEASLLALLPDEARPPGVVIPFPPLAAFRAVCDKRQVLSAAVEVGLAIPAQRVVESRGEAGALDAGALPFPVVVKPSRSVGGDGDARVRTTVRHAADPGRLRQVLGELPEEAYPVLVQQRIEGPGVGVFLLLWDGRMRAAFAHRRLREKPPSGGVSVLRESVAPDPALVRRAAALLGRFGWQGVAMVELKVDAATGTPYLMEVNGRFWGSLQLADDAGVDFPALLLEAAFGAAPGPLPAWRPGVRSRWWWGDADHLLARLRRSPAALDLPADAPGRLRALADFALPPRSRNEVLRWSDPGPAVRETVEWVRAAAGAG